MRIFSVIILFFSLSSFALPLMEADADANLSFAKDLAKDSKLIGYYEKLSGPSWLNVDTDGFASGTPRKSHKGKNSFKIACRSLSGVTNLDLNVFVYCSG